MGFDEIDRKLLAELQANARTPYSELGRRVGLSAPAVTDRVRRLEERGVITGYHARVDPAALGYPLRAVVRLQPAGAPEQTRRVDALAATLEEVISCHHVTGTDCYVLEVVAASMAHLERVIDGLLDYGSPTTSVVLSTAVSHRVLDPPE